jgi:hypothetical protein
VPASLPQDRTGGYYFVVIFSYTILFDYFIFFALVNMHQSPLLWEPKINRELLRPFKPRRNLLIQPYSTTWAYKFTVTLDRTAENIRLKSPMEVQLRHIIKMRVELCEAQISTYQDTELSKKLAEAEGSSSWRRYVSLPKLGVGEFSP